MEGTVGNPVIDIRKLQTELGYFTFDSGFMATASCKSRLTYIDGDKGQLMHGGYSIDESAGKSDFLEVCYLLLHGNLLNRDEKDELIMPLPITRWCMNRLTAFPWLSAGCPSHGNPMWGDRALSAFYHDSTDISDPIQRMVASRRLIAKMPTLAAMAFKYSNGQPFNYPVNNLTYAENFRICVLLFRPKIMLSIRFWPRLWIKSLFFMQTMNKMPLPQLSGLPDHLAPIPLPVLRPE